MIEDMRRHLGTRLLLSYLAIILIGVVVLILASQFTLPAAFNRHMSGMGMMGGMMGNQGMEGSEAMTQLYLDFRASFNEALFYAAFAAVLVAIFIGVYLSRSIVAPVQAMSRASQHIADGHYDERVQIRGVDELSTLAVHFNQMAEKLSQVETIRRRLIGDVSHELRTPLTAIKGSMEGLLDGVLPATPETYQQVHAEAERLNRLVDDLQELSRVEARAYDLELRPLDIPSLVQTVIKRLKPQFETKHISLNLDPPAELPRILGDEGRVVQILTNLIGNAFQYTPENGRIFIRVRELNNEVEFAVQDTGVGIPAEHLPHIFDRFYRADKSRSRRAGGGSGIGLTIARELVETHGGKLRVESKGEGQGSTFSFTLQKVE